MLLVVVEVAAAGLTIAGAGAVTVGALAVPVCGAAVACCLVHSSYCTILHARVSTCVDARVGWLVGCGVRATLVWLRARGVSAGRGLWRVGWCLRGECRRECGCYFAFSGGLGMWRVWPSWRSCSASSAVMTRPMMGGHASAYLSPAHTARSWAASCGADTGCVVCSLSGLVYPSVVSSAAGPMAAAQRWVSSDRCAAMLLTCWSPRYVSPVAVVSPWPSPACFRLR